MAKKTIEPEVSLRPERVKQLTEMGMLLNEEKTGYILNDNFVDINDVENNTDEQWSLQITTLSEEIEVSRKEGNEALVKRELSGLPEEQISQLMNIIKANDILEVSALKKQVQKYKRKYANNPDLTFTNLDDKERYKAIEDAWRACRDLRTKTIDPKKKLRTSVLSAGVKFYNDKFNPLAAEAKLLEDPLGDILVKWDKDKKERDEAEKQKLKVRETTRIKSLEDAGAAFDGAYYIIESVEFEVAPTSIGSADIETMSDELFDKFLAEFQDKNKIIQAAEVKKKEKAEEEAEEMRLNNLAEDEQRETERKELAAQRIEVRAELVEAQGMVLNEEGTMYVYDTVSITLEVIGDTKKPEWDILFAQLKADIKAIKDAAADKALKTLRRNTRPVQLESIGFKKDSMNLYLTHPLNLRIPVSDIELKDDAEWDAIVSENTEVVNKKTAKAKQDSERLIEVLQLGFAQDVKTHSFTYLGAKVDLEKEFDATAELWPTVLDNLRQVITTVDAKAQLQRVRYQEIVPYAAFCMDLDLNKLHAMEPDAFKTLLAEKKGLYDKKVEQDAQNAKDQKQREANEALAKSNDDNKWKVIIDYIANLPVVEMTTNTGKEKLKKLTSLIENIKAIQ